jgi:hypothetical protein
MRLMSFSLERPISNLFRGEEYRKGKSLSRSRC